MEPKQQLSDFQETLKKIAPFLQKNKKWSIIFAGIICLIVIAYVVGAYTMDPRDTVTNFEQAVRNGDVEALQGLINSPDDQVDVDTKHIQDLITYSKENADYLPNIVTNMMNQIVDNENDIPNAGGITDYYLKKTTIPLFYSLYSIEFRPYFLQLSTNEAGATVKVDNKKVFVTTNNQKSRSIGPLMPGIYKTTAEKPYPYAVLSSVNNVTAFNQDNAASTSDLSLNGSNLKLESNFDNTAIFVNGKSIGKTVKEMPEIGPIAFNGTIRIHGEQTFPWGKEKSPDVPLEEDTSSLDITPLPFASSTTRQPIVDIINNFSKQMISSRVKHDANQLTNIGDNLKASFIRNINDDVQFKNTWKGETLGTRIDFDNVMLSLNQDTGIYEAAVPVEIHAKYKKYYSYESQTDPLEDKLDYFQITLSYNEKTKNWLITDQEDHSYSMNQCFNGKNTVKSEFK